LFSGGNSKGRKGQRSIGGCAPVGDGSVGIHSAWVRVTTLQMRVIEGGETRLTIGPSRAPFGVSIFGQFGDVDSADIDFGEVDLTLSGTPRRDADIKSRAQRRFRN